MRKQLTIDFSARRRRSTAGRQQRFAADDRGSGASTRQDATFIATVTSSENGTRSEQLSADQLRLFAQELGLKPAAESEQESKRDTDKDEDPPGETGGVEKNPRGRQRLPRHLKRERIVHDLTDADKHCAGCDQVLRHIGEEVSERYEYIPAQMLVIEDACQKYACACTIRTANKPAQPIEKRSGPRLRSLLECAIAFIDTAPG